MTARFRHGRVVALLWVALVALVVQGCASYDMDQGTARVNREAPHFTQGQLALARTQAEREQRAAASQSLLAKPLGQAQAVQLMLLNSPAFQSLLAQHWAEAASAAQSGRLPNPSFALERMVSASEVDLARTLSFGLLELLTWPQRASMAHLKVEQAQVRMTTEVVDQVTRVRQAWVHAVASAQTFEYAVQVFESAQASAELAKRMESVGNFNKLTRARHHAFYADAATQLANAQQAATTRHEELVRLLGLDEAQAPQLALPKRLPALPAQALSAPDVSVQVRLQRLDIQQAQLALNAALKAQGLGQLTRWTDIELSVRSSRMSERSSGASAMSQGFEVGVKVPLWDWGDLQRDVLTAQTWAAVYQLEAVQRSAASSVRESYAAYRTAYDVAKHYKNEIIPLRKVIADENVLRYNAMLIGVFELLADSREQITAVMSALAAEQQFWLAEAALQAHLIGRPALVAVPAVSNRPSSPAAGH